MWEFAMLFVTVTGLDGQEILLNKDSVVALRSPREPLQRSGQYSDKIHCIIQTSDGKVVTVVEDCGQVRKLLEYEPRGNH